MKKIYQLSDEVISKIAAGEVIDHPASIIKELVENALDADALHVDITLSRGGIEKISVKDDGNGMSQEDLQICFLPHTTSKINSEHDLFSINSFGFRGEALSSIAAVSNLTIKSRQPESEHGYSIEINNGLASELEPIGMPVGTEFIIEGLFNTIPARKKFLRSESAELQAIVDVITSFAMAFPHIGFCLINNHKSILQLPGEQSSSERMQSLLGEHITSQFLPLSYETEHGIVSGFIGHPQSARAGIGHQYLFINNRPLTSSLVNRLVSTSFGSLIEPRTQSMFVLFLSIPLDKVDINIHPRKLEVGLAYKSEIDRLIESAIQRTLEEHNLTHVVTAGDVLKDRKDHMDIQTARILKEAITPWNVKETVLGSIMQVNNLYLVAQTDEGLLLVDQHAAHERILYEQFKEALSEVEKKQSQFELEKPLVIHLSVKDALILETELKTFSQLGFDIETFGQQSFKVSKIPELFKTRNIHDLIIGIIDDIQHGRQDFIQHVSDRTLAYLACRAAIKAGDALTEEEAQRLVQKLLSLKTPYTCPHGRPTHISLSMKDLDVLFKRR